jgi:hypothetical protein
MSVEHYQNNEMTMGVCVSPGLEAAIENWQKARLAFQNNRTKENQDHYCKCCDELGQCIVFWATSEQPQLAYEFGNWFRSHEEDWAL